NPPLPRTAGSSTLECPPVCSVVTGRPGGRCACRSAPGGAWRGQTRARVRHRPAGAGDPEGSQPNAARGDDPRRDLAPQAGTVPLLSGGGRPQGVQAVRGRGPPAGREEALGNNPSALAPLV